MKNIKTIKVNWNDMKSIERAEKKKTRLENENYHLIYSTVNISIYKKADYKTLVKA